MMIKKLTAIMIAGVVACTAPVSVMAAESTSQTAFMEDELDSLLSDPDKAVDVIMYVKELVDQQEVSDEEVDQAIDMAAEHFQITISDEDKEKLIDLFQKFKDLEFDEEELRSNVKKVYEKMDEWGVGKDDVKNFLEKGIDFVKSLFE
ncbi:DUF1002 domain-containing protein [Blautia schinkii]|nr:DUF1002 domain-containing protein [Blautia schinkii]